MKPICFIFTYGSYLNRSQARTNHNVCKTSLSVIFLSLLFLGVTPGIPNIDKGINQTAFDNLVRYGQHWTYNQTQKVVESVIFQYTDWVNQTDPLVRFRQKYMDVITDSLFKAPAVRSAHIFVKNKLKDTFFYCFDHVKSKFPTWAGVFHGSDLIYVFGRPFAKYNKSVSEDNQTAEIIFSKKVITFWSNFAKAGWVWALIHEVILPDVILLQKCDWVMISVLGTWGLVWGFWRGDDIIFMGITGRVVILNRI